MAQRDVQYRRRRRQLGPASGVTASASSTPQNLSFGSQIGLNQLLASDSPYDGSGYTVAVIDTGIDYNNPALGGGWGNRVIAGWDFVNNDADPMDDNGHGTHVAGIIGSTDATYSGIAPNVKFVALKVLGADGSGSFGAVSDALDWVVANRTKYNIVAVNMSLGSGNYTVDPYMFLENDMQTLVAKGVFIGVAAGNDYYSYQAQGLAFPAISPNVVSVGARPGTATTEPSAGPTAARDYTTAPDRIASFSQRSASLSIFAPGAMITSTYLGDTFRAMAGTSMATPVIVGSAVVLREELDALGHADLDGQSSILGIMQSTGVSVVDGDDENTNVRATGLSFKRIDLGAAVSYVSHLSGRTPANSPPTLAGIGTQNIIAGKSITVIAERRGRGRRRHLAGRPRSSATTHRAPSRTRLQAVARPHVRRLLLHERVGQGREVDHRLGRRVLRDSPERRVPQVDRHARRDDVGGEPDRDARPDDVRRSEPPLERPAGRRVSAHADARRQPAHDRRRGDAGHLHGRRQRERRQGDDRPDVLGRRRRRHHGRPGAGLDADRRSHDACRHADGAADGDGSRRRRDHVLGPRHRGDGRQPGGHGQPAGDHAAGRFQWGRSPSP